MHSNIKTKFILVIVLILICFFTMFSYNTETNKYYTLNGNIYQFCYGQKLPIDKMIVKLYNKNQIYIENTDSNGHFQFKLDKNVININKKYYLTTFFITSYDMNQSNDILIDWNSNYLELKIMDCFLEDKK